MARCAGSIFGPQEIGVTRDLKGEGEVMNQSNAAHASPHSPSAASILPYRLLLLMFTAWACLTGAYATAAEQSLTYVERPQISTYFGGYIPKPVTSLDDLPVHIQTRLAAHLIERLGQDYFRRLIVSHGEIVDAEELYRIDPSARNYRWLFAYRVGFRLSDPERGIKEFTGYIKLSSDGSVLKEIEFPAIAKMPWKANLVSFASAMETARARGLVVANARIDYSRTDDVLAFILEEEFPRGVVSGKVRTMAINAHTGELMSDKRHLHVR